MDSYPCIFKTDERVDAETFYDEFLRTCSDELVPAYADEEAWTGVRVFDLRGTDRLGELPYLRSHLDAIGMENVSMVNYYNMAPHSAQHAHRDQSGNLLFGIARLHLPLKTNPGAVLEVEHRPYRLATNEVWSLDTSGLHAAQNEGDEGRVHLVIDVKRAPSTAKYFPAMTTAVRLHLVKFVTIMAAKVVRDAVTKPRTLLDRVPDILRMVRSRRVEAK